MGDNCSPPPTENPTAPPTQADPSPTQVDLSLSQVDPPLTQVNPSLSQVDPSIPTPNEGEFDAECPAPPPLSSSTTDVQRADTSWVSRLKLQKSKPLFRGFERPSCSRITILTVLCLLTYPAFLILTLLAKDTSLFIVRLVVSVWCSIAGLALGYVLLSIGARHLEAASGSTLVERRNFLRLYLKQPGPP